MRKIARRTFMKNAAAATALGGGLFAAPNVWGQAAYPNKFIVPLAPAARSISSRGNAARCCRAILGQQVFVENRTGAGGTIGMDTAMKATPDGYTFLITNDNAAIAPHVLNLPTTTPRSLRR